MKYTYSKVKGALGEAQQSLHWFVKFTHVPTELKSKIDDNFVIRCSNVSLPTPEITHTEIQLGGFTFKQPGKVNKAGEITLTLVEGTDAKVLDAIHTWLNLYWSTSKGDTEGHQRYAKDLYATLEISLMDGRENITQQFEIIDCLPGLAYGLDLGQEATNQNVELTLSYNDFHWKKGTAKADLSNSITADEVW